VTCDNVTLIAALGSSDRSWRPKSSGAGSSPHMSPLIAASSHDHQQHDFLTIHSLPRFEKTQLPAYPGYPCAKHRTVAIMSTDADSLTNCRFYEEKYPEIESFVMVNVKQVSTV